MQMVTCTGTSNFVGRPLARAFSVPVQIRQSRPPLIARAIDIARRLQRPHIFQMTPAGQPQIAMGDHRLSLGIPPHTGRHVEQAGFRTRLFHFPALTKILKNLVISFLSHPSRTVQ